MGGVPSLNFNTKKNANEQFFAFFDAEYTCYMKEDKKFDRRHSNEVISVGLIIADQKLRIRKTFYSAIKPQYNPILTGYCKSLTGLKQSEIDRAPDYENVFQKMSKIFDKYPVREIFVWGSDHRTLEDDIIKNHTNVAKNHKRIVHKVADVTKKLTIIIFGKPMVVSLADMKYICDRERAVAHNAFDDAKDLYLVYKTVMNDKYNKRKANEMLQFVEDREEYHRYRRLKPAYLEDHGDLQQLDKTKIREFRIQTENYISILKRHYYTGGTRMDPAVAALCDDLRILSQIDVKEVPKIKSKNVI